MYWTRSSKRIYVCIVLARSRSRTNYIAAVVAHRMYKYLCTTRYIIWEKGNLGRHFYVIPGRPHKAENFFFAYERTFVWQSTSMPAQQNFGPSWLFFQKVLMHLLFPQTYEPFLFLNLTFWILETEICLEIDDVLNFDSLEDGKGKKATLGWLVQP